MPPHDAALYHPRMKKPPTTGGSHGTAISQLSLPAPPRRTLRSAPEGAAGGFTENRMSRP